MTFYRLKMRGKNMVQVEFNEPKPTWPRTSVSGSRRFLSRSSGPGTMASSFKKPPFRRC